MKIVSVISTITMLLHSPVSLASQQIPIQELNKIKKLRDANEYMAKRHVYYDRVDLSFSKLPINKELPDIKDKLAELSCSEYDDGCDAKDKEGNDLYFWGAYHEKEGKQKIDYILTIKIVDATEFEGRSIGALGIGTARKKSDVISNIQKFLPGLKIDCDHKSSGNVGPVECGGTVDPGWFQIGFDEKGNLLKVRFDGYHFT